MSEADKIEFYYQEGKKIWTEFSQKVISKSFFELWEQVQKPLPFLISPQQHHLSVVHQIITLPNRDVNITGYYCWDESNDCAALFVETSEWYQEWLLTFCDGDPLIYEQPMVHSGAVEISRGEKMEIIYDLIVYLKRQNPNVNLLSLSRKEMTPALDSITENYPPMVMNLIKRLPAESIKKLFKHAVEDMAADEISNQLELPLDGNYAANTGTASEPLFIARAAPTIVHGDTKWTIAAKLNFIAEGYRLMAELENKLSLPLNKAEIIACDGKNTITLKVQLDDEYQIAQGDILRVFLTDNKTLFGTFKVDIFDGMTIYGRLQVDLLESIEKLLPLLFLQLPQGTAGFIHEEVNKIVAAIDNEDFFKETALQYLLGLSSFQFLPGTVNYALKIDDSQKYACAAAFLPSNPIVLIQGPPGTGKTFLLEQIAREFCRQGLRILITAPSNTAIDNICRRITDLPLLRFGKFEQSIAPDVAKNYWISNPLNVDRFVKLRNQLKSGGIYAGTHLGLLRDDIINDDIILNGTYDVIIFDEAGMANVAEFMLCAKCGKRLIALGDHRQLPPFPMPHYVAKQLYSSLEAIPKNFKICIDGSVMEWLADFRHIPVIMLKYSYRCQNPRLLRFASTLFYDAGIRTSDNAEYYKLGYQERLHRFPASSLCFYSTSRLPLTLRGEKLFFEGQKPGLANSTEAKVCAEIFYQAIKKYPIEEICIIAPYRKQVKMIRQELSLKMANQLIGEEYISEERWQEFLSSRVATVDSFQGGESDLVIISYVRSNENDGIGFIGNHNRINVAHTRCRRELHIVGDMECLKRQADSNIFTRMEKAFKRDGLFVNLSISMLNDGKFFPFT
jgi:hypothetical protein